MDEFIDFLEENKTDDQDRQTIANFKNKINKPIKYKQHLGKFKFNRRWFAKLDIILTELGYRALDMDINYIKKELKKLITDRIHINTIITYYNLQNKQNIKDGKCKSINHIKIHTSHDDKGKITNTIEQINFYIKNHPEKIDWYYFSGLDNDIAVGYCLKHLDEIDEYTFQENANDLAVGYMIKHRSNGDNGWDFSSNVSDNAIRHITSEKFHFDSTAETEALCANENDLAVEYLIKNPEYIEFEIFIQNKNIKLVEFIPTITEEFILSMDSYNIKNMEDVIDFVMDSSYILNEADIAVRYIIHILETGKYSKVDFDWDRFHENENSTAVSYCVIHCEENNVPFYLLCPTNKNDIAVHYYIERYEKPHNRLDDIYVYEFSGNESDIAVSYLIKHPDLINWHIFTKNENVNAVRYCIRNIYKVRLEDFILNENIHAVDYFIRLVDMKNLEWKFAEYNKNIFAEWKLRMVDELKLLPMSGLKLYQ